MSVTVEKPTVQEIKGDTVAPGLEGLLSLQPEDFVFYVGGYPSNFTVSLAQPRGSPGACLTAPVCPDPGDGLVHLLPAVVSVPLASRK